jgi:hypothetical protein
MQEAIQQPTSSLEASDPRVASALRAEAWAGEPFLREGENPDEVLAEGTARRRALDEAIAEIDSGRKAPSSQWKVRYGLLLGLERVLAEPEPRTASGTLLRRHQVDALAGMLTELIAASQRYDEAAANGNGNGHAATADELEQLQVEDEDEDSTLVVEIADASFPRSPSQTIPAPSAVTASAIPPLRARRSPRPGSSRRRARSAS